jgi:hypothetical protein
MQVFAKKVTFTLSISQQGTQTPPIDFHLVSIESS